MLFVQQAESFGRVRRDENAMSRALENLAQTTTHARFVINDEQRGGRSDVAGRSRHSSKAKGKRLKAKLPDVKISLV